MGTTIAADRKMRVEEILGAFGMKAGGTYSGVAYGGSFKDDASGAPIETRNPSTGDVLARVRTATPDDCRRAVTEAHEAFTEWRLVPAPRRGEIVRLLGDGFRARKEELARLISLENGKILSEARGEVQEVIDICDLAVGQSRQLFGKEIASERRDHRLVEQWHPLGVVGIISAFNFPVAVPGWGWALALVCGDTIVWKPSSLTPLISVAAQQIFHQVTAGTEAERVFSIVTGSGSSTGEALLADERVALIQATGSCALGERVAIAVAKRSGRAILELGGNNAVIVLADADLKLALRAVVFGTVGTAGQRCTSTRRLILQRPIAERFLEQVVAAYRTIGIGDPLDDSTLMGPLVSQSAVDDYSEGLAEMQRQGGRLVYGGKVLADRQGYFVEPTIVHSNVDMPICKEEVFAPIVHVFEVDSLEEAIAVNNSVPQGLSSGLFTTNLTAAERWLSAVGSDCGIANVNAGTSGAEIGGAFGGEKATGGGRQAGSDAWKGYMRRQTCTINYGDELPLAQGVTFPVD
ncbi:MAG TPA: aldehyde dehydrogenase family protein [Candidatus Dormibacteraeota bacterium]|nr:aldehyde dehydrogenase family protein [Candidatus Dormibacteraeota bacterium]